MYQITSSANLTGFFPTRSGEAKDMFRLAFDIFRKWTEEEEEKNREIEE